MDHSCYFCRVFVMLLCVSVYYDALWSPARKRLSFAISYCEFVTVPLVSWVRSGT